MNDGYQHYDIITSYFPIVSDKFFNKILENEKGEIIYENRSLKYSFPAEFLSRIDSLLPTNINPSYGISYSEFNRNRIGISDHIIGGSNLRMINDSEEESIFNVLYIFVPPKTLSDEQMQELNSVYKDDAVFVKGVMEGWSIMFFDYANRYCIQPGLLTREEFIKNIPDSIKNNKEFTYYNLDGSLLFGE